ncbi:MAG: type I secretion system permease/ATPase [Desulfovibrionaceae bacterium]
MTDTHSSPEAVAPEGAVPAPQQLGPLAPSDVDFSPPLLRSLATLLRLRGKVVSAQYLLAGLAGSAQITPGSCLRAVARAGLKGSILYRKNLSDILPMTMPCVLLLTENRSCVLLGLRDDKADVIFPEDAEIPKRVAVNEMESVYSGYALFAVLEARLDARSEKVQLAKGKRWFWDVLRFYMPIYRHVAFASIVINLIGVISPLFVMNVYDRVVPNNALETLWVLAIGITIAYLFDFLLRSLRSHFVDVAGRNADVVLSSALVDKVLTMRLDSRPESTGALVNNLREFEALREFFSSSTLLACIDVPFLFLFLGLLFFIGGPLGTLPLVAMPLLFAVGVYLQRASKRSAEENYKQNMHKNALLVEMVNGLETIKSSMAESRMQHLWESVVGSSARSSCEGRKYNNLAIAISMLVTQLVTVATVVWGVYLIAGGKLTMGGLIGCNILLGRTMAPLMQMASLLTRFQNSQMSLTALDVLMALPSENQDERTCVDFGSLETSFVVENISFSYPGSERQALSQINLTINQGEKVGIVGRMGSGKSTLGKLLIGLYQPAEGAVRMGGVDIRQLAGADLRGRVGFLPQDVVLFYGSIRENIALGDPSINDHLILRAANLSGVVDFVRQNPAGFGAQVGEQGRALSGGQRQAVALARALVRDPEVLILDEPTSNMDNASEFTVQKRLQSVMQNKTLILITHRLSMLEIVDRLVVIDAGRIVMDGPKAEILQRLRAQVSKTHVSAPPDSAPVGSSAQPSTK